MSILNKLASSLHRRDEMPNLTLARNIVRENDKSAVKELFQLLGDKRSAVQSDSIKVIYELAVLDPQLIKPYFPELISLLRDKNNRLQWGAMTAINILTNEMPDKVFKSLPDILQAADKGSVISKDQCMSILCKLCSTSKYSDVSFALFNERLLDSLPNQFPMYAENALLFISGDQADKFADTLKKRIEDIVSEPKRKRIRKILAKLQNK